MSQRAVRRRAESGAAALEFALVVPLLVMLILGVITAGLSFHTALGTTDAVREGSRFGATTMYTPAPSGFGSWSSAVQAKTTALAAGSIGTGQVCVKLLKGSGTQVQASACAFGDLEPDTPTGVLTTECVVKVWAKVPVTINIGIHIWTVDILRTSVSKYERECA